MKKSLFISSLALFFIVLSILVFAGFEYQRFFNTPLKTDNPVRYTVKSGMNLKQISHDLKAQGLTDMPPFYLQLYGRMNGQALLIKAGEYELLPNTTLPELLEQLVAGKVVMNAFTVVEGMTAQQLITQVSSHPKIKATLADTSLSTVMAALAEPDKNGEGWFLPETYYFPTGTTDIDFLRRAYQQMQIQLEQAWQRRDKDLPYQSAYDALIMASIIEKETAVADERPQIAGVFVRRLKKGMRLQTDPTVIYGLGSDFDGNLRRRDLRSDTPYNTYTRSGLPPTPICLPSIESIEAALHPADGSALYFVATGKDGRHVFSSNLNDHNQAVRRYQLKR